MEFKIGAGLACVGIAVGLGQWLIPPDTINSEVRLALVSIALAFGLSGTGVLLHAAWKYFVTDRGEKLATIPLTPKPITKTSEETENERFHNQRKGALKIEFTNDYSFKSIGPTEGHGLDEGNLQKYRVEVHNTTGEDIGGVQVWLESITPMPPELMGHGGLPLHITHEAEGVSVITLRAHEKRGVDVVSFFDKFWQAHIRIHHTSAFAKQEIYNGESWNDGGEGYQVELVAKGDKVDPFSRRFKIGVKTRDLYMVSLDQPEAEAFAEGYRDA